MTNRECALYLAVQTLLPYAQSRVEDMIESDDNCLFARQASAAIDLGEAALCDNNHCAIATARKQFEEIQFAVLSLSRKLREQDADYGLSEVCGPSCPCKEEPKPG